MATTKKTSTAVAVKKPTSGNIVSIMDALKALAAAVGDKTAPPGGNRIQVTQDKQFILPDGTKTPGPLELVIVDFASMNRYYPNGFDSKNIVPPHCFALGDNPQKLVPSANAPEKQCDTCAGCANSKFGPNSEAPACKGARVLAVLPPDADKDTPMWILTTSPTATKGFDGFVTSVARVFQTSPLGVVTTVGFDPNQTYAKLVFSNPQPNANVAVGFGRQDEAKALLAVEPDVSGFVKAPARGARGAKAGARR